MTGAADEARKLLARADEERQKATRLERLADMLVSSSSSWRLVEDEQLDDEQGTPRHVPNYVVLYRHEVYAVGQCFADMASTALDEVNRLEDKVYTR